MPQSLGKVADYSAGYPGAANLRSKGYTGVIRYLRKEGSSKVQPLTAAEYQDMQNHGLGTALVYQHVQSNRPTQGRGAGQHDARWALDQAAAVGIASPRAIYFAVDFDANPSTVTEYFRGAADVLGLSRTGGYGGFKVVDHLFDLGLIRWGWQTVAWSGGKQDARAHLFQQQGQVTVGGVLCDVNQVWQADYGQHPNGGDDVSAEQVWGDDIKVTSPLNETYSETHPPGKLLGDTYFKTSDTYWATMAQVVPMLTTLIANTSDDLDADTVMAQVTEAARLGAEQALLTTVRPALEAVMAAFAERLDGEVADEIVSELSRRLAAASTPLAIEPPR